MGGLAAQPVLIGGSSTLQGGDKIRSGPQRGRIVYITPSVWGVLNALEQRTNQLWPMNGLMRYITLAIWGVPMLCSGA